MFRGTAPEDLRSGDQILHCDTLRIVDHVDVGYERWTISLAPLPGYPETATSLGTRDPLRCFLVALVIDLDLLTG